MRRRDARDFDNIADEDLRLAVRRIMSEDGRNVFRVKMGRNHKVRAYFSGGWVSFLAAVVALKDVGGVALAEVVPERNAPAILVEIINKRGFTARGCRIVWAMCSDTERGLIDLVLSTDKRFFA